MDIVTDALMGPFQYSFMLRALIVSVLVGIMCPALGVYVVVRGLGFMGDALAHSVLPGMVLAFMLGISPFFGSIPMAVATAPVERVSHKARRYRRGHICGHSVRWPLRPGRGDVDRIPGSLGKPGRHTAWTSPRRVTGGRIRDLGAGRIGAGAYLRPAQGVGVRPASTHRGRR